jgi:hypothetical protein
MPATSRAYLHCHSSPSTPPEHVYELAKARGMDFVTITDRDSIDRVLEIADRPDVFLSVELTARFRDSEQTVSLLCYGVSVFDHGWLQRHSHDVEVCTAYMREHSIGWTVTSSEVCDGVGIGGGYAEVPRADTPWEFLGHLRRSAILDPRCGTSRSSSVYCSSLPGLTRMPHSRRAAPRPARR